MLRVQKQPLPPKHIDLRSIYPLILSLQEQEMAGTGNMLRVDAVYGDDALANRSPFMNAYRTVGAALTQAGTLASASLAITVLVMPGTYDQERFTIPNFVSLMGICRESVILRNTMTTTGNYVTMGTNTALSNLTLTVSVNYSSSQVSFSAINFPGSTSTNSSVYNVDATITHIGSGGTNAANIYGVLFSGDYTFAKTDLYLNNTILDSKITAIGRTIGTNQVRVILVQNKVQVRIKGCTLLGTEAGTSNWGISTLDAGALVEVLDSTVRGINLDLVQTYTALAGPSIRINSATNLIQRLVGGNGFEMFQPNYVLNYGVANTTTGFVTGTHFLQPSIVKHGGLADSAFRYFFPQRSIAILHTLTCNPALTSGQTITVTIRKNDTAYINLLLTGGTNSTASSVVSEDFATTDNLRADAALVGLPAPGYTGSLTLTIACY